jgi:hypothetical protein
MKSVLTMALAALMLSLVAFTGAGISPNKAQIVLQSQSGETTFTSKVIPTSLDATGRLAFEFKPSGFTSGDQAKDGQLRQLFQDQVYRVVMFTGQVEKSIANLTYGASIKTAAVGRLNFAGKEQALRVPVTITKTAAGKLVFSADAVIDWASNPATKTIGTDLNLTGPIRFNITPTIK